MKRKTCAILAVLLTLALLFGACGNSSGGNNTTQPTTEKKTTQAPDDTDQTEAPQNSDLSTFEDAEGLQYVLIYNPRMYDENNDRNETLTTGKLGSQVDTSMRRADALEKDPTFFSVPQNLLANVKAEDVDLSGSRADSFFTPYKKGDVHEFYCFDSSYNRMLRKFECIYTGEIANVWKFKDDAKVTDSLAEDLVKEFEETIYEKDVALFGEPRFTDNGHKVNIMLYDTLPRSTVGVFTPVDLFATGELTDDMIEYYGVNLDHAMFAVNSSFIGYVDDELIYSTIAHEFQHLINFTDWFEYDEDVGPSATWINEAMSGFVEDYIYPGVQNPDRYEDIAASDMIRYGQSLYNFDTKTESYDFDIGVYGSVFLFSTYLENLAGDKVFYNIHNYWRNAVSTSNDAQAIRSAVSDDVDRKIDAVITYPDGFVSDLTDDEQWLSKLTLSFYLEMLKYDSSDPDQFEPLDSLTLLYDQVNASDIEGGGRVIVAVKDGNFTVPDDADEGLVYIGMDKDFNVITQPVFK